MKSGLDPGFLIAEVKKFASAETARGNVGTRYIPQATKWLNEQRWADHAAVAAAAQLAAAENLAKEVFIVEGSPEWDVWIGYLLASTGRGSPITDYRIDGQIQRGWWRDSAMPPPELLAKYGLGPDGRKLPSAAPQAP